MEDTANLEGILPLKSPLSLARPPIVGQHDFPGQLCPIIIKRLIGEVFLNAVVCKTPERTHVLGILLCANHGSGFPVREADVQLHGGFLWVRRELEAHNINDRRGKQICFVVAGNKRGNILIAEGIAKMYGLLYLPDMDSLGFFFFPNDTPPFLPL